jgi:hypothetical protein
MKNFSLKSFAALSLLTVVTVFGAANATAAQAPNLEVRPWLGSVTPQVESPYQYTTRVRNIGNQTAQNVVITVEFPLTNTSPTRYILGKLSAVSASSGTCSTAGNKITCNVGNIGNNQTRSVTFTFEQQVSTVAPFMKATATTASLNEVNANNNTLTLSPSVTYPNNIVTGGIYLVTSCTGTNLTSFYECERSPGSTQTFEIDLDQSSTLSIPQAPGYFGFWDQNTLLNKSLHFTIDGGSGTEAEFNGFASSGTCFKGITTFPQNPNYNSAYRVCKQ